MVYVNEDCPDCVYDPISDEYFCTQGICLQLVGQCKDCEVEG